MNMDFVSLIVPGIIPNLIVEIIVGAVSAGKDTVVGAIPTVAETACHAFTGDGFVAAVNHVYETAVVNPTNEYVAGLKAAVNSPIGEFVIDKTRDLVDSKAHEVFGEALKYKPC